MRPALTFIEIEFMTLDLVQQSAHAASGKDDIVQNCFLSPLMIGVLVLWYILS